MHRLRLEAEAYSIDAIQRAAYRFCDRLALDCRRDGEVWECTLHPRGQGDLDEQELNEFRVELLDQALRERIRSDTEPLRNLVLSLAFSRTDLVGD